MTAADGPVWAIVLAGGGGTRFGARKQYADLGGRTLLERTVATATVACDHVVLVVPPEHLGAPPVTSDVVVAGGDVRAESVRNGLAAVPGDAGVVVVADAAHPLAPVALFAAVVDAVRAGADAAVPGLPLTEAVATVEPLPGAGRRTGVTHAAAGHVLVQTPQAFRPEVLREAHALVRTGVEDSSMAAAIGATVVVVPGDPLNVHVTTPAELEVARLLLPAVD